MTPFYFYYKEMKIKIQRRFFTKNKRWILVKNHTQYKIVEQTEQPDGSIIVKVIKQYNSAPVGDYLN